MNKLYRQGASSRVTEPDSVRADGGFGLIEILISIMLLGILAVSLLPILVQGLRLAASNATLGTATLLANDELEHVRTWTSCSEVAPATVATTDSRGVDLTIDTAVGSCTVSAENPASVSVTVTVTRNDTGVVVTSTTTYLFISEP
ncbi:hypothetical protein GCM10022239_05190 [Leifsonia bigeumensis]|uniref:Prepilin-type N-terminal cleavage/methylation domain-containing protein n=1 Tax=Leifsonella bigeumensis TaxID=433643 RepID=A0ABP7F814_9MICO